MAGCWSCGARVKLRCISSEILVNCNPWWVLSGLICNRCIINSFIDSSNTAIITRRNNNVKPYNQFCYENKLFAFGPKSHSTVFRVSLVPLSKCSCKFVILWIWPKLDLAEFTSSDLAGALAGIGFERKLLHLHDHRFSTTLVGYSICVRLSLLYVCFTYCGWRMMLCVYYRQLQRSSAVFL